MIYRVQFLRNTYLILHIMAEATRFLLPAFSYLFIRIPKFPPKQNAHFNSPINFPCRQSTDRFLLYHQSLLCHQFEDLYQKDTERPRTQASPGDSALLRYRACNNLHRLGRIPYRTFFLTFLKSPAAALLTGLESGNRANSNSVFLAGFAPRRPVTPQISAFFLL
jgi:hypothetical protein